MFRFRFVPRLGLCLLATLATFLYGQVNTSSIAGLLTDESGAVVPHAKVTVTQDGTGLVRTVTNSDSGEYVVPQLPPGKYSVKAEAKWLPIIRRQQHQPGHRAARALDFTLHVGAVSQQIEVTGRAEVMDTDSASLGQTIERRTASRSALERPQLFDARLAFHPESCRKFRTQGPASFVASTTARPDRSILVGGQRESSTSYLLDGVELRNPRVGDTSINPSIDAVQEFKIQRNFFEPEFGNSPGIINVATKSGTNQWHGSVYELCERHFDARNFFSATPEPYKRNQFGASLGAPIIKDKLFIFGNYEGMRQRVGVVQRGLYPTQTLLSGNFAGQNTIYDPLSTPTA